MPPRMIRLGTASPGTLPTTAETLASLEQVARGAAAKQIDILLLPEAFIGGYPRGTAFGCVIGNRSAGGRDEYLSYFQSAVDLGDTVGDGAGAGEAWIRRELDRTVSARDQVNGKEAPVVHGDGTREELERIARETGVFIVTGCIEKAGGSLYCAVVYVCPKLGMIGKRRKVMPTGTERLIWAQGSPATLQAVSTIIRGVRVNLAAAICWENYMPLLRQSLYAQNVNLYLAPTADGRDAWLSLMRTVGIEGRCFVVSSNMCVRDVTNDASRQPSGPPPVDSSEQDKELRGGRRSSCVTQEGFEIALPSPNLTKPKSRRRSVFDRDGNEIVLSSTDVVPEDEVSPRASTDMKPPVSAKVQSSSGAFVSRGGSSIVSPFGDVIAGPQWEDDEGLIFADVDFEDCIRGRLDLDNAGSYSRNDSFKFSVEGLKLNALPY